MLCNKKIHYTTYFQVGCQSRHNLYRNKSVELIYTKKQVGHKIVKSRFNYLIIFNSYEFLVSAL